MTDYATFLTTLAVLGFLFATLLHRALKSNGQLFLDELFRNNPGAGRALARLLDIGYLLFNVGYLTLAASFFEPHNDPADSARGVAAALGVQLLLLSMGHGINVWLFSRKVGRAMRQNEQEIEELLRS